jgi:hypothetical protein
MGARRIYEKALKNKKKNGRPVVARVLLIHKAKRLAFLEDRQ